jgi:RecJ-like exonuclease
MAIIDRKPPVPMVREVGDYCGRCSGQGEIATDYGSAICPICKGTGYSRYFDGANRGAVIRRDLPVERQFADGVQTVSSTRTSRRK